MPPTIKVEASTGVKNLVNSERVLWQRGERAGGEQMEEDSDQDVGIKTRKETGQRERGVCVSIIEVSVSQCLNRLRSAANPLKN